MSCKHLPLLAALAFMASVASLPSCRPASGTGGDLQRAMVVGVTVGGKAVPSSGSLGDVPADGAEIVLEFTSDVSLDGASSAEASFSGGELSVSAGTDPSVVVFRPVRPLDPFKRYSFALTAGPHFGVDLLEDVHVSFTTAYDPAPKFPEIPDDELLTLVQQRTFDYFWSHGHPVSGLARERLGSGNTVTAGGSGFGIMTLPVAVERGFITRAEAAERLRTIVTFLRDKADRFHGVYPHWMNGETGKTIPFSSKDNGGDLVETAFLLQGLLTAAQYFDAAEEADIRAGIDAIWRAVEWDWYTQNGQNALYWHWSPDQGWAMNMRISGWNEGLIVYVLAASSPTHSVGKEAYDEGWARSGGMRNGRTFYGTVLPLGSDLGGPMFFAHYSFLGLDPRGLKDTYASYWDQNVAHARINHAYCAANPKGHAGYSDACWGLTASDYSKGYTASSPTNDRGTIAPTAALASFPYVPEESLKALREFYYVYGDRLWGEYGFYDAFSLDDNWFAKSYIAIDQGPIVVMMENYRTGLLWRLFMQDPDVRNGLSILGFTF